jgi:MoaA/NifB/PqqE/SkfB family radical SAM enzyme
MIDINFYQKFFELKKMMLNEGYINLDRDELFNKLESYRSLEPVLFNIETTNICNMDCIMCPAPQKMKRKRETMSTGLFEKIINQITPFSNIELEKWYYFVNKNYGIKDTEMNENHFFLYIIPKVLVLHGYGEPLLDNSIVEKVKICKSHSIPTYFSCNIWNLKDIRYGKKLFESGLNYIKFHTDSSDDISIKQIRGNKADFTDSLNKIYSLIKLKEENGYKVNICITMLDLNRKNQEEDFNELKNKFEGKGVYIYLKSQDQVWYNNTNSKTKAIHWLEPCQFPWSSMTIKSDGIAAQCVEDYNNEIILGDTKKESLYDIWNGSKYINFRKSHINMDVRNKCTSECDMKLIGRYLQ